MGGFKRDYENELVKLHNDLSWRRRHPEHYYDGKTLKDIEEEIRRTEGERDWARRNDD